MMPTINDALDAYQERVKSAVGDNVTPDTLIGADPKLILLGLGLDQDQIETASVRRGALAMLAVASGMDPLMAFSSIWADGVAVGKIYAVLQDNHKRADKTTPDTPAPPIVNPAVALNPAVKDRLVAAVMEVREMSSAAIVDTVLEELVRQGGRPC